MLDACAAHDNLRMGPEEGVNEGDLFGGKLRAQFMCDAMGWSGRTGCARQLWRCCDTRTLHNNPLLSEDVAFVFGDDKAACMSATSLLGGPAGLYHTIEDGVKVTNRKDADLREGELLILQQNPRFAPFLRVEVEVELEVPRKDGSKTSAITIFGGDAASANAGVAQVEPNDQSFPCDQCLSARKQFHSGAENKNALRRNFALGSVLSHLNPFTESRLGKRCRELIAEEVLSLIVEFNS